MQTSPLRTVLGRLRQLAGGDAGTDVSDTDLLERFRTGREEAAFALLMQRHGPMVLGVCRRLLSDAHEAEDAFQAAFLVLVRNAGSIRKQASLASWLHGVAYRVAAKVRGRSALRRLHEQNAFCPRPQPEPLDEVTRQELCAAIDEELVQLPEKYRVPLLLCWMEGKTHDQAARELAWPKSSVSARLRRAQGLLRQRLSRRGFALPAGALSAVLAGQAQAQAVSGLLTLATVRLASESLAGLESPAAPAVRLAEEMVHGMAAPRVGASLALLLTIGLVVTGLALIASPREARKTAPPQPRARGAEQPKGKPVEAARVDLFGDPLPPGARARMGTVRLRHGGEIGQFAFAPDSKVLAAASNNDAVCLWDVETGRELRRFENVTAGQPPGVAFSPDGMVLATGQYDVVRRWNARTWSELPRFRLKSSRAGKLFFSPDGKVLVCLGDEIRDNGNSSFNMTVFLDAATGRELHRLEGLKFYVAPRIAFSPDSKTWAYVDRKDKTIRLADVRTGKLLRRVQGHSKAARTVAFSPDGRTLASTDEDGTLRFWNAQTGELLPRQGQFEVDVTLVYTPDGKRLVGARHGGGPILFDLAAGKQLSPPRLSQGGDSGVVLSPDGKRVAWAHDHCLHLCDAGTLEPLQTAAAHEGKVGSIAFSSDGKVLASAAGQYGFVCRWEAATGKPLPSFSNLRDYIYTLAYSPDGRMLAVGTGNNRNTISLLHAAAGKRIGTLVSGHGVTSLAFAADNRTLASGLEKDTRLWDVVTGKLLQTIPGSSSLERQCALAADAGTLAVVDGHDDVIHLYQATTGKELRKFSGQTRAVFALAFAPDGKTLVTGGEDATVKLWDPAAGRRIWEAKGHKYGVFFVAFSPDGKSVASGGWDGSVRLWEAATGKERWRFEGHRHAVRSGVFSPDGKLLATGSADTTVLVWDLAPAETRSGSRLSAGELDACWTDLGGEDARKAFQAIHLLAANPGQALPLLRDRLKPLPAVDPKRLGKLLKALDSAEFAKRKAAAVELEPMADAATEVLRRAERDTSSAEVRRALQGILERLNANAPERRRIDRAVEVLEWLRSPGACDLLDKWAAGAAGARLTREAAEARERLRKAGRSRP